MGSFDFIIRSLYIADNSNIDARDTTCKIRPLFDHPNCLFTQMAVPLIERWAIDEVLEPHFEKFRSRQNSLIWMQILVIYFS